MKTIQIKDGLTEIVDYRGRTPPKSESGITLISAANIKSGMLDFSRREYISEEDYSNWTTRGLTKSGDVLFTTEAPTGEVAIHPQEGTYQISRRVIALRTDEKLLHNLYLFYLLQAPPIKYRMLSANRGSTVPRLLKTDITDFLIDVPDHAQQQKIANTLSCLDLKIKNLRKQNETLEAIAQTLFKQWFINFEFPNADGKPYKSSGGAMEPSELGKIPVGWRVGVFSDFIEHVIDNRGKTPPFAESGFFLIEGNQIFCNHPFPQYAGNDKQKFVSEETYDQWFRSGHPQYLDILCATVGSLPKWCFCPKKEKICIAQNIIAIRANKNVCTPYWLRLFMNTRYFTASVMGRLLTTAQPSIKVGHMQSIEIIIPSLLITNQFSKVVQPIFEKSDLINQQIKTLTRTRDALLPKLMSGKLRIKD